MKLNAMSGHMTRETDATRRARGEPGVRKSGPGRAPGVDRVSISAPMRELARMEPSSGAGVDTARVESARARLADGQYRPDPGRLAEALLDDLVF